MIARRRTFILGIFIFLLPFLGLPSFWKTLFVSLSGLLLIALSMKFQVPKKVVRPKKTREKTSSIYPNATPLEVSEIKTPGEVE